MQVDIEEYNEELIEALERQAELEYQNLLDEECYDCVNSQNCTD